MLRLGKKSSASTALCFALRWVRVFRVCRRRIYTIGIDDAEIRWQARVENAEAGGAHSLQQEGYRLLVGEEFNLDTGAASEFEKAVFVHRVPAAETPYRAKCRAARHAELG